MSRLFTTTAFCTALLASPALADLSVDDAWGVWKAQIKAIGLTMDAAESRDGGALVVGEMRLSANLPFGAGSVYATFPGPRFEPADGGSVKIVFPDQITMTMGGEIKGEGAGDITFKAMGASTGVMTGSAQDATTVWTMPGMTMELMGVNLDGTAIQGATGSGTFGAAKFTTRTRNDGQKLQLDQEFTYDSQSFQYAIDIPDPKGVVIRIEGSANMTGMSGQQAMTLPVSGVDIMALPAQLRSGLRAVADMRTDTYSTTQKMSQNGKVLSDQRTSVKDYKVSGSLDRSGLNYGGDTGAFDLVMKVAEMPITIDMKGARMDARIALPLLKSEAPQDARFRMNLQDFAMSEGLWSLFDPEKKLPRDAATLTIDLGGKVQMLMDLVDIPAFAEGRVPRMPALVEEASLSTLMLKAAGAQVSGQGKFTLDNKDWSTIPGMPRPEGAVDLAASGVSGLLAKLVEMGLIKQNDMMGAMMMIGMFSKPGTAPDTLTSKIEINKEGHVLANGQRLR